MRPPSVSRPEKESEQVPAIAAQDAQRPLDALNFFLADVRDGLGPYLAIYLLTMRPVSAS